MMISVLRHRRLHAGLLLALMLAARPLAPTAAPGDENEPVVYVGPDKTSESDYINGYHDGRLRPAIGVQNYQVLRANRSHPEWSDGLGWTYNHAPNLAYWNGKFYYHYLNTPFGEHVPPGMTMLTTSTDGKNWERPRVLFPVYTYADADAAPHSVPMHQRMGFYVASDGRLLAFGFYGINDGSGIGRVVREIYPDDDLGPIYFIRPNDTWDKGLNYPLYTASSDAGFVAACQAFLNDPVRRMQWWEENRFAKDAKDFFRVPLPGGKEPGKAFCFYTRPDGVLVGLFKSRWATLSRDGGQSWTSPVQCKSLTYGGAKIWAQRLDDGTYAAVYNPSDSAARHPLAVAVSRDGIRFDNLACVHGEVPVERYWGNEKRPGPQYVRGITPGDGHPPGKDLWVAYSVSKEDLWIARIPVPIRREVKGPVHDDFDEMEAGGVVAGWNVYCPKWCPVEVVDGPGPTGKSLMLSDRDPYDYAKAVRVFGQAQRQSVSFQAYVEAHPAPLDIELTSGRGDRHVQFRLDTDGTLKVRNGQGAPAVLTTVQTGVWHVFQVDLDAKARTFSLTVDGQKLANAFAFSAEGDAPERIEFRTGDYRMTDDVQKWKSGDEKKPGFDESNADEPVDEAVYYVRDFHTEIR
jgi:hypothetical protein